MTGPDKPARAAVTGVLVVDKPAGMSSMGVVAAVRRRAGGAKTGHAGTLDPLATGVLVLALGRATRIIARLMTTEKRYLARIDLSAFTETDDREGPRIEVAVARPPGENELRAALAPFVGTILQRPPAFSAVKIDGRRAYRLARRGKPVEIPEREVIVHGVELLGYAWPCVDIALHCGHGVYVRSLARDLGLALGTGGHCASIRRTAVGPFTLETALPLDDVPDPLGEADLLSIDDALARVEE